MFGLNVEEFSAVPRIVGLIVKDAIITIVANGFPQLLSFGLTAQAKLQQRHRNNNETQIPIRSHRSHQNQGDVIFVRFVRTVGRLVFDMDWRTGASGKVSDVSLSRIIGKDSQLLLAFGSLGSLCQLTAGQPRQYAAVFEVS